MKTVIFTIVAVLSLGGCAGSQNIIALPELTTQDDKADLVVFRNRNIIGAPNSYYITIDSQNVFKIDTAEYTKFHLEPGAHQIGVKCFGGWSPTWKEDTKEISVAAGETQYFVVSPDGYCADIKSIGEREANYFTEECEYVAYKYRE